MSAQISWHWRNCQFSVVGEEDDTPVEYLLDIVPLRKKDAENIYLALVRCIRDKHFQVGNIVGMGFDGPATISGKRNMIHMQYLSTVTVTSCN